MIAPLPRLTLLALALTCVSLTAVAEDDAEDSAKPIKSMSFNVEAGVKATVRQTDLNSLIVTVGKGKPQTLPVPFDDVGSQPHLQVEDFNFDGHKDLAWVLPVGMVNETTQVFLYDPASKQFAPLPLPPAEGKPLGNCDMMSAVTVEAKQKTLTSACRGGPMWYGDTYRYSPAGRLYLYQVQESLPVQIGSEDADGAPAWVVSSYDADGKKTEQHVTAYDGGKATLKVPVARLTLHEKADATPSKRYVIKGDLLELTGISDDQQWLKVQYHTARKSVIDGWVSMAELGPEDAGASQDQAE